MNTESDGPVARPYRDLIALITEGSVRCAVFKGTLDAGMSLRGACKDVDLFVAPSDRDRIRRMLEQTGFVHDASSPNRVGEEVLVYRSLDPASGSHLMVHLHFGVYLGVLKRRLLAYPHVGRLLEQVKQIEGLPCVSPGDDLLLRLLKNSMNGVTDDPYLRRLMPGLSPSDIPIEELEEWFGVSHGEMKGPMGIPGPDLIRSSRERIIRRMDQVDLGFQARFSSMLRHRVFTAYLRGRSTRNKMGQGRTIVLIDPGGANVNLADAGKEVLSGLVPLRWQIVKERPVSRLIGRFQGGLHSWRGGWTVYHHILPEGSVPDERSLNGKRFDRSRVSIFILDGRPAASGTGSSGGSEASVDSIGVGGDSRVDAARILYSCLLQRPD